MKSASQTHNRSQFFRTRHVTSNLTLCVDRFQRQATDLAATSSCGAEFICYFALHP